VRSAFAKASADGVLPPGWPASRSLGEGWSERVDSNHRPPASEAGALGLLSYTPIDGAKGWVRTTGAPGSDPPLYR
jgi:hypothetical protein